MASSISDFAPLAAIPPRVWPSTWMGSPPWLGKKSGKARTWTSPFFNGIGAVFRRRSVERRVPGFFLRELNGVERGAIRLLQKKQIAAFIHNADGDFNILFFSFRFRGGDHGLDRGQIQIFPGGKIGGRRGPDRGRGRDQAQHHNQ